MSTETNTRHQDLRKVFIVCAVLFSLLAHVLLVWLVADYRLNPLPAMTETIRRILSDKVIPMQVEHLKEDPTPVSVRRPEGEVDRISRGPVEASGIAKALGKEQATASELRVTPGLVPVNDSVQAQLPTAQSRTDTRTWLPRQAIAAVMDRQVQTELPEYPRREIADIPRIKDAPDVVPPVEFAFGPEPVLPAGGAGNVAGIGSELFDFTPDSGSRQVVRVSENRPPPSLLPTVTENRFSSVEQENKGLQQKVYTPIDDRLQVSIQTYTHSSEPNYLYYRMTVRRRSDKDLPVLAKDVVFVQDVSASIAEERLEFCRRGMIQALSETLRAEDRFMVLAFRDTVIPAFENWQPVTAQSLAAARQFIDGLKSEGNTDLFVSLRDVLRLRREQQRPLVIVVVTDGRPTAGLVESTRIIGDFTRMNNGAVSIFAFGTQSRANAYLLDMLTYCNRGGARILKGNRWDIPDALLPIFASIRNPVMSDVFFAFDSVSGSEVYPKLTTNLYADRPLEIYGRCEAGTKEIASQIRGQAGPTAYDVVFRLDVEKQAQPGDRQIRKSWSEQKMYWLIGEYARNPAPEVLGDMKRHGTEYALPVPYRTEIGR